MNALFNLVLPKRVSNAHVVNYYSVLIHDAVKRIGVEPENSDSLPRLIMRHDVWEYFPRIPVQMLRRARYWTRGNLPRHHLNNYLTEEGTSTDLLAAAHKFLALIRDQKVQAANAECFNRPQTQVYVKSVCNFMEILRSGGDLPPLIATTGRSPFSKILLVDGNTRGLAVACLFLEDGCVPSLGIYIGRKTISIKDIIVKVIRR